MNRETHLQWCKVRANVYIDSNNLNDAFASFMSDMGKHEETQDHMALEMGTMLLMSGNLSTQRQMKEWVNGFN